MGEQGLAWVGGSKAHLGKRCWVGAGECWRASSISPLSIEATPIPIPASVPAIRPLSPLWMVNHERLWIMWLCPLLNQISYILNCVSYILAIFWKFMLQYYAFGLAHLVLSRFHHNILSKIIFRIKKLYLELDPEFQIYILNYIQTLKIIFIIQNYHYIKNL
jgi:hypothetical protein